MMALVCACMCVYVCKCMQVCMCVVVDVEAAKIWRLGVSEGLLVCMFHLK